jgi:hypothetical protein
MQFHMHVENEASTLVHCYYCVLMISVVGCFSYVWWRILLEINEDVATTADKMRECERNAKSPANLQERRNECIQGTARANILLTSPRVSFSESSAMPNYDLNNNSLNHREKHEDQERFNCMGVKDDKRHIARDACQQLNDGGSRVTPQRQKRESGQAPVYKEASRPRPPSSRESSDGYLAASSRDRHNFREDWIPSAPHDSTYTLKQLVFLAQQLDEKQGPVLGLYYRRCRKLPPLLHVKY